MPESGVGGSLRDSASVADVSKLIGLNRCGNSGSGGGVLFAGGDPDPSSCDDSGLAVGEGVGMLVTDGRGRET